MVSGYDFKTIEPKWQKKWDETGLFDPAEDRSKPKYYVLVEFPYPSGDGLHVGHPRSYSALDAVARYKRLKGFNVLFPFGWDAFGLPTENYAIKNNIHPRIATQENIKRFKRQCKMLGLSFAWQREVNTTDPAYYKWTQWIFIQLFKKGLAYKTKMPINWCTSCNVGLANEEVVDNLCERCGGAVVRKERSQWMLKITDYAEKLLDGLNEVQYIEKVVIQQRNWIGKSEGSTVRFALEGHDDGLEVFTTRPDTLFGATYMVIAPEHRLVEKYQAEISNLDDVRAYVRAANKKSDLERAELVREKTGVEIKGLRAVNPINNASMPIWVSDYVLMSYGTGAIMAVPAHDERDYEFATKFALPIVEVIKGGDISKAAFTEIDDGEMVNSGFLNGMLPKAAIEKATQWLEEKKLGKRAINYKLRDWVFSRQRYWGEPIPVVHCDRCGWVTIPESELPLVLPEIEDYRTTADGDSPLAKAQDWVKTTCPACGGAATRETDTMPQWAGSSWYYLRYADPHNATCFIDPKKEKYWLPVDWYNGGLEHTTLHLLYSRFWHKVLYDLGFVSTPEPYIRRTSHGMVLGSNGEKMSKSRGNVVNPDDIVGECGADTFRLYEMFMGPFDQAIPWNSEQISGVHRFLIRVWNLLNKIDQNKVYEDAAIIHKTIRKVEDDLNTIKFNTAISQLMMMLNEMAAWPAVSKKAYETLVILLSPFAPHVCEELWQMLGHGESVQKTAWPAYDAAKALDDMLNIPVTIDGKRKENIDVPRDASEETVKAAVRENEKIQKLLAGKTVVKEIYVKNRIFNIVTK